MEEVTEIKNGQRKAGPPRGGCPATCWSGWTSPTSRGGGRPATHPGRDRFSSGTPTSRLPLRPRRRVFSMLAPTAGDQRTKPKTAGDQGSVRPSRSASRSRVMTGPFETLARDDLRDQRRRPESSRSWLSISFGREDPGRARLQRRHQDLAPRTPRRTKPFVSTITPQQGSQGNALPRRRYASPHQSCRSRPALRTPPAPAGRPRAGPSTGVNNHGVRPRGVQRPERSPKRGKRHPGGGSRCLRGPASFHPSSPRRRRPLS